MASSASCYQHIRLELFRHVVAAKLCKIRIRLKVAIQAVVFLRLPFLFARSLCLPPLESKLLFLSFLVSCSAASCHHKLLKSRRKNAPNYVIFAGNSVPRRTTGAASLRYYTTHQTPALLLPLRSERTTEGFLSGTLFPGLIFIIPDHSVDLSVLRPRM